MRRRSSTIFLFVALALGVCEPAAAQSPSPDAVVWDSFTATNGSPIAGRPPERAPTGMNWLVQGSAAPTIQGNQAVMATGSGYIFSTVDAGMADATIAVDVIPGASLPWGGLVLRMADTNNFLLVRYRNALTLMRVQAGAPVDLGQSTPPQAAAGSRHRLEVQLQGDRVSVYWDGAPQFDVTSSFQQTATRHGLLWYPPIDAATALDAFELRPPPAQPPVVVSDQFTAANGTSLAGRVPDVAPGGVTWIAQGSNQPTVQGDRAIATAGSGYVFATVDTAISNVIVAVDVIPGASLPWGGLVLRMTDTNNFLLVRYRNALTLMRVQGGTPVDLGQSTPPQAAAGSRHRIAVRLLGDRIWVYWDGAFQFEALSSFQQTISRHGLLWYPPIDSATALDAFELRSLAGGGGQNNPPLVTGPANQSTVAGRPVSVGIVASDPEGSPLTYSATGLPPGLSVNPSTGLITGTVPAGSTGTHTVIASASDGAATGTRTFSWIVTANRPPVVTGPPDQTHFVGTQINIPIAASDPDSDPLTYGASGLPPGIVLNSNSGVLSGPAASAGVYSAVVSASDGLATTTSPVNWTIVTPPNGVIVRDTFTGPNGTLLSNHSPDIAPAGASWSNAGQNSTATLQSGWVGLAVPGGGHQRWTLDAGASNVTVSADYVSSGSRPLGGIIARSTDIANLLLAFVDGTSIVLYRVQNGSFIPLRTVDTGIVAGPTYRLEVRATDDRIQVYVNGNLRIDQVETFQRTATRHGLSWNDMDPSARFDNFEVLVSGWAPVITGPSNQTHTIGMNASVSVPITATDPEGSPLTYAASGLPSGLAVNASTGLITGSITAGAGTYTVATSAFDGIFTSTRSFTWTVIPAPASPPADALVFDTFSSNGAAATLQAHVPDLVPVGGSWRILEGSSPLVDAGMVRLADGSSALASVQSGVADGKVAVDFQSTSDTPVAGLVLRATDGSNLLLLRFKGDRATGRLELVRRVNGTWTTLTSVSVGPIDAATHRIEAWLDRQSITAVWDGAPLFAFSDNRWAGEHGLYWDRNVDPNVTYDNFRVTMDSFTALPLGTRCEAQLSRWFIPAETGNTTVGLDVTMPAGCTWSTRMLPGTSFAWVTSATPRTESGPAQFSLHNNTDIYPRVAHATVAGQLVTIVQAGVTYGECQYSVAFEEGLHFDAQGRTETVSVSPLYPSCTWAVESNRDWIAIAVSDGTPHSGSGNFTVTVPRHDGTTPRTGIIKVGNTELSVEQVPENCPITVSGNAFHAPATGDSGTFTVTAPAGCGWHTEVSDSQMMEVNENPDGNGTMPIRIHVFNNPAGNPQRSGYVDVVHSPFPPQRIYVTQDAVGMTTLDPTKDVVSYYHTDAIGSVRLITDAGGQVLASYDYLPFGEEWNPPAFRDPRMFTGAIRDEETELDYLWARHYKSQIGRFLRPDDAIFSSPANPQSWNLYGYALNNPLRYVDPTGHDVRSVNGQHTGLKPQCVESATNACVTAQAPHIDIAFLKLVGFFELRRAEIRGFGEGVKDTVAALFSSSGPPSCLGIALKSVVDELNPISPGLGEAAGAASGILYANAKHNEALRYAATRSSRRYKTPFLLSPNKSTVFQAIKRQSARGGYVALLVSADVGLVKGLLNEWEAAKSGACR